MEEMSAWSPTNVKTILKFVKTHSALSGRSLLDADRLLEDDHGATAQRTAFGQSPSRSIDQIVQVLPQWDENPMQDVQLCWIDNER